MSSQFQTLSRSPLKLVIIKFSLNFVKLFLRKMLLFRPILPLTNSTRIWWPNLFWVNHNFFNLIWYDFSEHQTTRNAYIHDLIWSQLPLRLFLFHYGRILEVLYNSNAKQRHSWTSPNLSQRLIVSTLEKHIFYNLLMFGRRFCTLHKTITTASARKNNPKLKQPSVYLCNQHTLNHSAYPVITALRNLRGLALSSPATSLTNEIETHYLNHPS